MGDKGTGAEAEGSKRQHLRNRGYTNDFTERLDFTTEERGRGVCQHVLLETTSLLSKIGAVTGQSVEDL